VSWCFTSPRKHATNPRLNSTTPALSLSFTNGLPNISFVQTAGKEKDSFIRIAAIAAAIAAVFYLVFFNWMQNRHTSKGPWEITFITDSNGTPSLAINQSKLQLSHRIIFNNAKLPQTNMQQKVLFDEAVKDIPFGKMQFQDPTFLPGNVTMEQFGHQVQLLPRVLKVDKQEHAWTEPDLHLTAK
jgi:hypothetical protein